MGLRDKFRGVKYYRVVRVNLNTGKSEVVVSNNNTIVDQSELEMESGYRYSCVAVMKKGTKTMWSYSTTPVVTREKQVKELPPLIQIDPESKAYLVQTMEGFADVIELLDKFRGVFLGEVVEAGEGGEQSQPPPQGQYPQQQTQPNMMLVPGEGGTMMAVPAPSFGDTAFPWWTHPYGLHMVDKIMEKAEGWVSGMGEKFGESFKKKMFSVDESEDGEPGESVSGKMLDGILGDE